MNGINWHRGLWRFALGLLGLSWAVVLFFFSTGDIPGFKFADVLLRMGGATICYLVACKLIEWVLGGFRRQG